MCPTRTRLNAWTVFEGAVWIPPFFGQRIEAGDLGQVGTLPTCAGLLFRAIPSVRHSLGSRLRSAPAFEALCNLRRQLQPRFQSARQS